MRSLPGIFSKCSNTYSISTKHFLSPVLGILCLFVPAAAWPQTDIPEGITQWSTQIKAGPVLVDMATGNMVMSIRARSKPGAIPFAFDLMDNIGTEGYLNSNNGFIYSMSTGMSGLGKPVSTLCGPIGSQTKDTQVYDGTFGGFYLRDGTGAKHPFFFEQIRVGPSANCGDVTEPPSVATDGSGYTAVVSGSSTSCCLTWTVYNKDGDFITTGSGSVGGPLTDPDGNAFSGSSSGGTSTWIDTLGQPAMNATFGTRPNPDQYFYTDSTGTTKQYYTVAYSVQHVKTVFGCNGEYDTDKPGVYLPSSVTTPTGAKYSITYETTPGNSPDVTGRLGKITLPTGGYISFAYSGGTGGALNGFDCHYQFIPTLQITSNDNNGHSSTTTYQNTHGTPWTVTETDQLGDVTTHYFAVETETERIISDVHLGTLSTTITCFNGNFTSCGTAGGFSTRVNQTDVYTYIGTAAPSLVETKFDLYGNITEVDRYDVGAAFPPSGSPISKTTYTYDTSTGPCGALSNPYMYDRPCSVKTVNSAGTQVSLINYTYNSKGHPTQTSRWISGTTYATSYASYNPNGTLNTSTDPKGNITTLNYDGSCNSLLSTSTTLPTANGIAQKPSQTWDCNGGVVTSTTDANTNVTHYYYTDPLWRRTQVTYPDGGSTTTTYSTGATLPWSISTSTAITSSTNRTNKVLYDGLGRATQSQLTSDPTGIDYVDTTYDALGRTASVSNPYRSTTESTYGITQYSYDALDRPLKVTNPDGTFTSTSYTGNATEVGDEGNGTRSVQRISQVDGLGRLQSVCEVTSTTLVGITPTPAACGQNISATGFLTSYTYDALGNLSSVAQGGLNGRTFAYDGLSRLTSAINPESGTVTYTYDANGNLSTRIAPKPNQTGSTTVTTTYAYDALNRLTGKTYSDGTPGVALYYDQPNPWGAAVTNYIGRLTQAEADNFLAGSIFSYDSLGRIVNQWECTPSGCGTAAAYFAFTYDLLGDLTTSNNNGDNITYTNSYDAAARLTSVQSSLSDSQHPGTLAGFSSFNAFQKPVQVTLGNGIIEYFVYSNRGQVLGMNESPLGSGIFAFNIINPSNSANGYAPNGNILYGNDSAIGLWKYTYDDMNRLASGTCSAGCPATAGVQYTYDRFGNRWQEQVTAGTGIQPSYTFDAKNHISSGGVVYDAAGNVTNDGLGTTYTYDAENRIITAANVSNTASYVYDAQGHRVQETVNGQVRNFYYDLAGRTVGAYTPGGTYWLGTWLRGEAYAGDLHVATYANSTTAFHNGDWLGTFRMRSDVLGHSIETCSSLPFGEDLTCSGAADVTPNHFTGKESDTESGLSYFGFRHHTPTMGRFMTPDPSALYYADPTSPQSLNLYGYVLDNPLVNIDPNGLDCIHINVDTGRYEGFDPGDCNNSTEELANSGVYVDGSVNTIYTTTGNSQGVVTGYSGANEDTGALIGGMFASGPNESLQSLSQIDPDAARVDAFVHLVAQDVAGFPDICSGGFFLYAGAQRTVGKGHGFVGYLGNYDSKGGWTNNGILEGSGHSTGVAGAYGPKGGLEGLVFVPFAEAGGGLVAVSKGGLSIGGYMGTPEKFPVGAGGGAYFTISTMGACHSSTGG